VQKVEVLLAVIFIRTLDAQHLQIDLVEFGQQLSNMLSVQHLHHHLDETNIRIELAVVALFIERIHDLDFHRF
jgi:hypothetical protein